jgi:hypothetical protein
MLYRPPDASKPGFWIPPPDIAKRVEQGGVEDGRGLGIGEMHPRSVTLVERPGAILVEGQVLRQKP